MSVSSYFSEIHKQLQNDYRYDNGYAASCTLVAVKMADQLKKEDKAPQILSIMGQKNAHGTEMLVPLPFEGRVKWGAHIVCASEGVVYDPILEQPLPVDEYLATAFDQPAVLEDESAILNNR